VSTPLFLTLALVAVALGAHQASGAIRDLARRRPRRPRAASGRRFDPGVERRAERRARDLLQSIVNEEEWEMYRDLGFIRVHGANAKQTGAGEGYGYLIYPHKPIVAYLQGSNSLLSEYCVEFPDRDERVYGPNLPDSDDVLAKWMMIRADEERLIRGANMHLPGRQVDPQQVRRDLWRLAEWERARLQAAVRTAPARAAEGEPATSAS
jgi:Ni/Co efflux regulator RcnB